MESRTIRRNRKAFGRKQDEAQEAGEGKANE
jgi:hypothetical protein